MGRAEIFTMIVLMLTTALVLYWRWVGYQGTDDFYYVWAAIEWADMPPALGFSHWSLRYALVLPMAGAIKLFGRIPFALAAPNPITYLGFLAVTYAGMRHWFGWRAAAAAVAMAMLLPIFPVQASYPNPDLMEAAFCAASLWCFLLAREGGGRPGWLFFAGVLVGVAFLAREISASLLITYSILFVLRPGFQRWRYFIMAAGFVLIAGGQMAYFMARTGDPLYRVHISARAQLEGMDRGGLNERAQIAGRTLDAEGVLAATSVLKPLTTVLVSQKFGLLFPLSFLAVCILARSSQISRRQRGICLIFGLVGLVSWLFVALNAATLVLIPRYFAITAAAALVPVATLLAIWWDSGHMRRAAVIGALFAGSSGTLLYLEQTQPTRGEQAIIAYLAQTSEPVFLDPQTEMRARVFLTFMNLGHRVAITAPPPGALVIRRAGSVEECRVDPYCGWRTRGDDYLVRPEWIVLSQDVPVHRIAGLVLRATGLDRHLPPDIVAKIGRPYAGLAIYRVPPAP